MKDADKNTLANHPEQDESQVDEDEIHQLLESSDFEEMINQTCQNLFEHFGPISKYNEWEDLKQEVLLKLMPLKARDKVSIKTAIFRATERAISRAEREMSFKRRLHEHALDEAFNEVLEQRQASMTNEPPASQAERVEDRLAQLLLQEGLLSEIPRPFADFKKYQRHWPATVGGKPVSETIIEERR